jgi:uncharacterized coiled-coil DUF342 family protein
MGQFSPAKPLHTEQPTVAFEIANLTQTLTAAHETLQRCIATVDGCQHSTAMHAQHAVHLRNEREQLRSAAAKLKRAMKILGILSTGEVNDPAALR